MTVVQGSRKETICMCISFAVLYMALLQVRPVVCASKEVELRPKTVEYKMVAPVPLDQPVYNPVSPFLGELTEKLSVGKIIVIHGYIPEDLRRFDISLCTDCWTGPMELHISVRFYSNVVVRNSYKDRRWQRPETNSSLVGFPFTPGQEFVMKIEVNPTSYFISVDGRPAWEYSHRLPYTSVDKIETYGSVPIWKIEYTDQSHETEKYEKYKYLVDGDNNSALTIDIKGSQSNVFERFGMDLQCECRPQSSSIETENAK